MVSLIFRGAVMKYFRLTATDDGKSRMEEVEAHVAPVDFIPDQPSLDLSPPKDAKSVTFIRTPAGWNGGWHPTPRRQFVIGMQGVLEFRTTDGGICVVHPGTIVLLEDTNGKGHHTQVVDKMDWWGVLVGLD
jgi:hypothetical protein